jgi:hypothetical protein
MNEQKALLDELIAKYTNLDNETITSLFNLTSEKVGWNIRITTVTVGNQSKKTELSAYSGNHGLKQLKHKKLMQLKRSKTKNAMLFCSFGV